MLRRLRTLRVFCGNGAGAASIDRTPAAAGRHIHVGIVLRVMAEHDLAGAYAIGGNLESDWNGRPGQGMRPARARHTISSPQQAVAPLTAVGVCARSAIGADGGS